MIPAAPIKLVALDLDGTLVNERLQISPRVSELLGRLILQTDVRVVIATGRMFLSALPFARHIGIVDPLIAYQGAMIRDMAEGHATHLHAPISLPLAHEVLALLLEERYHVNLYMNDALWTHPENQHALLYSRLSGVEPVFHSDLSACLTVAPTKMLVIDDHRLDSLLQLLETRFAGRLSYCRSRSNFCEIIDVSVSKWSAIRMLAAGWGIRPEEIMAIGDQGNDRSMIEHAGIGVAMGNAPDEVKACANYIVPPIDQDGAAEAIERFVFSQLPVGGKYLE